MLYSCHCGPGVHCSCYPCYSFCLVWKSVGFVVCCHSCLGLFVCIFVGFLWLLFELWCCLGFFGDGFVCLVFMSEPYTLRQILISITFYNTQSKAICLSGIILDDTSMAEIRLWLIMGSANQMVLFLAQASVTANKDGAALNSISSECRNNLMLQIRDRKTLAF